MTSSAVRARIAGRPTSCWTRTNVTGPTTPRSRNVSETTRSAGSSDHGLTARTSPISELRKNRTSQMTTAMPTRFAARRT